MLIILSACSKEDELHVDSYMKPYIDRFEKEAKLRGVDVSGRIANLEAYIFDIPDNGVAGLCRHNTDSPNRIEIDIVYWNKSNDLEKEYVVFHELGHCVLDRVHNDEKDAQGNCVTIMQSGTTNCIPNYTEETRESYLDELFE
ncbi:MAG TPA: hypothetical protein P5235_11160 [Saprospiraceae bacterium]|nr:hypothetical protein [Saprospiraceae bacterium]